MPAAKINDEIIAAVVDWLDARLHDGEIKRRLKRKWKGLSTRTCQRALARAREFQRLRSGKVKDQHRSEALGFYLAMQRNPKVRPRDKLFAQERIDRLLGLEDKSPVEGSDGALLVALAPEMEAAEAPPGTIPPVPQPEEICDSAGGEAVGKDGAGEEETGPESVGSKKKDPKSRD